MNNKLNTHTILNRSGTILFILIFYFSYFIIVLLFQPLLVVLKRCLKKSNKTSVLFLENFPQENAGYYYRSKVWTELLNKDGIHSSTVTIFKNKNKWEKAIKNNIRLFLIVSMWRRLFHLFISLRVKNVIVRRELLFYNEYGNLFFERILLRIHPNAILDFDDDIGASKKEPRVITNWVGKILMENGNKFNDSLNMYKRFIVGSNYLKELVLQKNPTADISVIPTCVDFKNDLSSIQINPLKKDIVFGWTGLTSNMYLLDVLIPIFNKLSIKYNFTLQVISGNKYVPKTNVTFTIINIPWSLEKDVINISTIDIGLMPLEDNDFTRGKCGFKLIQYMSLGIPSIGQNITVNKEIIPTPNHGWLVSNQNEWENAIECALKSSPEVLLEIGKKAKQHIQENYTFIANYSKLKSFLIKTE